MLVTCDFHGEVAAVRKGSLGLYNIGVPWNTLCPSCARRFRGQTKRQNGRDAFVAGGSLNSPT